MDVPINYYFPKSSEQHKYIQERVAILSEQRKQRQQFIRDNYGSGLDPVGVAGPGRHPKDYHHREFSHDMEPLKVPTTSSSNSSSQSEVAHQSLLSNPYELRHGRRYLRELPYPLPVDLAEVQRQNLRTLLSCRVFGRAACSPSLQKKAPKKVLEIGCGSAYWSSMCHDYFASLGQKNVSFTGLDVAPLAPDLKKQGVNWTFVQHDLRRMPFPFEDEQFDLVMLKDASLMLPLGMASQKLIDESIRILRGGGVLEIWESDHVLRSLLPHPPIASKVRQDQDLANDTATFLIAPGTPFAAAQNKYLQQANTWIQEALDRRKLPPMPCARIAGILYQEPDTLRDVGTKRIAIPLGNTRWEKDGLSHSRGGSDACDSVMSKRKGKLADKTLTADQSALRQTALLTVLQMIESLEPLLREVSGKNMEEWSHWWALMMADLLDPSKATLTGECLEIGAWWATKVEEA